jgi:lipopolysaccharide export system protein LptC
MAPDSTSPHQLDPAVRRHRQQASERRQVRTRRIQFWRRALPMVIAGIASLLVLWIGGRALVVKLTSASNSSSGGVKMVNPRFYGRDSSNRAYVLGAQEASRDLKNGKTVTLAGPNVTLDADGTAPTHVQASRGVYREDQRKLSLEGAVQLTQSGGFTFSTPSAVVDTTSGLVSGQSGVKGDGPLGRIAASSYGVYDRGRRIVLKGDVRSHIVQ